VLTIDADVAFVTMEMVAEQAKDVRPDADAASKQAQRIRQLEVRHALQQLSTGHQSCEPAVILTVDSLFVL
jgi:hypothetical protein